MDVSNENEVVSLLLDFRLTTPLLTERYCSWTSTQVKNELRRLRSREVVESFPFIGKQVYYRLTERACRQLGVSRRYAGPPGPQAIRQCFGLLDFCAAMRPPRRILSDDDWRELTSESGCPEDQKPNGELYLDVLATEPEPLICLGLTLIDGRADPASILKKGSRFLRKNRTSKMMRQLVAADEFLIAVVTESDGKADAIAEAATRASFLHPIRLHVAPDLSQI